MNIEVLKEKLEGFDKDVEVKIKLHTGEVKEIYDLSFRNKSVGGDNIIYIMEENPYWKIYHDDIEDFTNFATEVLALCINASEIGYKRLGDDYFENEYILEIRIQLAKEADYYIQRCKLEKEVDRICGYYEPGCGSFEEIKIKLEVLKDFLFNFS